MKTSILMTALLGSLLLVACDRPTVVTVPATPMAVPGPAGPSGATGATGAAGSQGVDGATVIVVPGAAASSAN